MKFLHLADDSLGRCEHELRELGADAFRDGAYDEARQIGNMAEMLARCRSGPSPENPDRAKAATSSPSRISQRRNADRTGRPEAKARTRANTPSAMAYPRFERQGDRLVKLGWSKKDKAEYEHKAPFSAIAAFASHVHDRAVGTRPFSIDDLMPVPDPATDSDLPSYQVYLILGWLRDLGIIEKKSRDSYVHHGDRLDEAALRREFDALADR